MGWGEEVRKSIFFSYQQKNNNGTISLIIYNRHPLIACFSHENVRQVALNHLPRRPGVITCPNCLNSVKPKSKRRVSPFFLFYLTFTLHLLLFIYFLQFLPATHYTALALTPFLLFWVPYLLPCFQGKIHSCPYCKSCLGVSGICESSEPPKSSWYIVNDASSNTSNLSNTDNRNSW